MFVAATDFASHEESRPVEATYPTIAGEAEAVVNMDEEADAPPNTEEAEAPQIEMIEMLQKGSILHRTCDST